MTEQRDDSAYNTKRLVEDDHTFNRGSEIVSTKHVAAETEPPPPPPPPSEE
jgi:hypothetical protein